MAERSGKHAGWRRALTGTTLAAGLLIGSTGIAHADVLDDIDSEYDTGAGGGQVSILIHNALKLRAAGFVPSKGNITDLEDALGKRPNQVPLITALQQTVSYQKRNQARSGSTGPANQPGIGINTLGPGQVPDPNGPPSINLPLA